MLLDFLFQSFCVAISILCNERDRYYNSNDRGDALRIRATPNGLIFCVAFFFVNFYVNQSTKQDQVWSVIRNEEDLLNELISAERNRNVPTIFRKPIFQGIFNKGLVDSYGNAPFGKELFLHGFR